MRKLGKKYVEASNKVEKNKAYGVEEAVKLVKKQVLLSLIVLLKLQ